MLMYQPQESRRRRATTSWESRTSKFLVGAKEKGKTGAKWGGGKVKYTASHTADLLRAASWHRLIPHLSGRAYFVYARIVHNKSPVQVAKFKRRAIVRAELPRAPSIPS